MNVVVNNMFIVKADGLEKRKIISDKYERLPNFSVPTYEYISF